MDRGAGDGGGREERSYEASDFSEMSSVQSAERPSALLSGYSA